MLRMLSMRRLQHFMWSRHYTMLQLHMLGAQEVRTTAISGNITG